MLKRIVRLLQVATLAVAGLSLPLVAQADIIHSLDAPTQNATVQQPFAIGGWAIDNWATSDSGIDVIHIWAYPSSGAPALFVGEASRGARPDVAGYFGAQFANAGYGFTVTSLSPGSYMLAVFPHSSVTGAWGIAATVNVTIQAVPSDPRMNIDTPVHQSYVTQPFYAQGWSIDLASPAGTGVPTVHVWALPTNGGPGIFIEGTGENGHYGVARPDVGNYYGSRFTNSGWYALVNTLPPGEYDIAAFSYSSVAGGFNLSQVRRVNIDATVPTPTFVSAGGTFSSPVNVQVVVPADAEVRFTRDGSTPTQTSELYTGPFQVSVNTLARARAFAVGRFPSGVAGADYSFATAAPSFSQPSGVYTGAVSITLSSSTPGANIYWTSDGSQPTVSSTPFTSAIGIPAGVSRTLKAIAVKSGWTISGTVSATYTTTFGTVGAPTASPAGGTVPIGQQVALTSPDPFSIVRYTLDGTIPNESSQPYFAPITIGGPTTINARAYRTDYTPSPVTTWVFATQLDPPTISPSSGIYASPPIVSMQSNKPGAAIRYTLDGSVPTASSSLYAGPFVPEPDAIVRAVTTMNGWTNSEPASGSFLSQAYANAPDSSPGSTAVTSVNMLGLNATNSPMTISFTGASGPTTPADVILLVNGALIPTNQIGMFGGSVVASGVLTDGANQVDFQAPDSDGLLLSETFSVWAGSRSLGVTVVSVSGTPLSNASISAVLVADDAVTVSALTNGAGQTSLVNLPADQYLELTISLAGYRSAVRTVNTEAGGIVVAMDVDNNEFQQGLAGWLTSSPRVYVADHTEASIPFVNCADCVIRSQSIQGGAGLVAEQQLAEVAQASLGSGNLDLLLDTKNQLAPQTATRRFSTSSSSSRVSVRYRFQSDEVVKGWGYNDSYVVTITNLRTGGQVRDAQGVVSLAGQFDLNGATGWRVLSLPIEVAGDSVEVSLSVANAVDNAYVSALYADVVIEDVQRISNAQLFDLIYPTDPYAQFRRIKDLSGLSVSQHNFYAGTTRVHGTLRLTGPADDSATSITVDVLEGGVQKASGAYLSAAAAAALLNRPFGPAGLSFGLDDAGRPVAATPLLLELPSSVLGSNVGQTTNGSLQVRFRMHTAKGVDVVQLVKRTFPKMVLYQNTNRYDGRDDDQCEGLKSETLEANKWKGAPFPCGGDGWSLPTVRTWAAAVAGVEWGDFSNMNAGSFPYHKGHTRGDIVDGRFGGYGAMSAAAANTMLQFFDTYGNQIVRAFVSFAVKRNAQGVAIGTYSRAELNALPVGVLPYWDVIRTVKLKDGRCARDVIRHVAGHGGHFDWQIAPAQTVPPPTATRGVCQ